MKHLFESALYIINLFYPLVIHITLSNSVISYIYELIELI
jgi:hypothetical protein